MEAVRQRHVSLSTEKLAKNRDKIVKDKAGGEEGGKRKNRSGRQDKIDGGETSHVDFTEGDHSTDGRVTTFKKICGHDTCCRMYILFGSSIIPSWSLNSC